MDNLWLLWFHYFYYRPSKSVVAVFLFDVLITVLPRLVRVAKTIITMFKKKKKLFVG